VIKEIQNVTESMMSRIFTQEVIANNLANINTAGFKKDKVFQEELSKAGNDMGDDVREITVFQQGPLKETGNPLDAAISGKGFFTIENRGEQFFTRDGHFYIDSTGFLRLKESGRVMGENGPIQVNQANARITIDKKGRVFVKGEEVDRLRITSFNEPYPLKKYGNTLFKAETDAVGEPAQDFTISQGYVEESNVNPMEEMVNMLTVFRYFEADQRVLKTHDELLEKMANQIGRV